MQRTTSRPGAAGGARSEAQRAEGEGTARGRKAAGPAKGTARPRASAAAASALVLLEPVRAPADEDAKTLGEGVYLRLRADLIAGRIAPGAKLPFRQLSAQYGVGIGPLREALMRLSSEQLVAFEGQRGFIVAPLSISDLKDLCNLRIDLTCRALRDAIAQGGEDWEDEILVALHRLERAPLPASFDDDAAIDEWERRHDRFHTSLIAACGSRWLLHFCSALSDQFQRYRRVTVLRMAQSHTLFDEVRGQHNALAQATLARNADEAVAILQSHFEGSVARVVDQIETFMGKANMGKANLAKAGAGKSKAGQGKPTLEKAGAGKVGAA